MENEKLGHRIQDVIAPIATPRILVEEIEQKEQELPTFVNAIPLEKEEKEKQQKIKIYVKIFQIHETLTLFVNKSDTGMDIKKIVQSKSKQKVKSKK